jgi:hypothetical protein
VIFRLSLFTNADAPSSRRQLKDPYDPWRDNLSLTSVGSTLSGFPWLHIALHSPAADVDAK